MYNLFNMKDYFKNFCNRISFKPNNEFDEAKIIKVILKKDDKNLRYYDFKFKIKKIIDPFAMHAFLKKINDNFGFKIKFNFEVENLKLEKKVIEKYLQIVFINFLDNDSLLKIFTTSEKKLNHNDFYVMLSDNLKLSKFITIKKEVNNLIKRFGFKDLKIIFKVNNVDDSFLENEKSQLIIKSNKIAYNNEIKEKKVKNFQKNNYVETKISQITKQNLENVIVEGYIFKTSEIKTKKEWYITTLSITDYSEAINVKLFAKTKTNVEKNRNYKEGVFVKVMGNLEKDSFRNIPFINGKKIFIIEKQQDQEKIDTSKNKRVELSIRTKMSTMDGIKEPVDFVKVAEKWGHKAIAIVDENSVQAFPDFYHATKNTNVKPIYGVSLSTITKNNNAIFGKKNGVSLLEDSYVVLDLETTGLSPEYEDIIEFGAVLIKNGQIVGKKQFFVKPTKKIPEEITKITKITNELVENSGAKLESEAILDIKDYLKDYTLVAHNAKFDINFINTKLEKYGHSKIDNPFIDTVIVAKMVLPKAKKFSLKFVAKKFNIFYDEEIAHRADYDANILARIWIQMTSMLLEIKISNQIELSNFENDKIKSNKFSKEITLLAKNQSGVKELFEYVSLSLTDNYFKSPNFYLEDLANRKNLLLGSGSLKSHLVDKMILGTKAEVAEEISRYDFIEIQPLKNFSHFIKRGFLEKDLIDMIKFVIKEAKKQNKIVVATGDVRYIKEKEKIYHEVYINAKGLGGVRHYLFKYDEETPNYPTQNILTTEEMVKSFNFLEDANLVNEIVIENSNKIADMIENNIQIIKDKLYTPKLDDSNKKLTNLVYFNAKKRYGENLPEIIKKRIEKELKAIIEHGYAVIYWISHKLVSKSLEEGYLVGSRGSVGSSFVATMSGITEVNPLIAHYVCPKCQKTIFPANAAKINSGYDLPKKNCENCNVAYDREGQNIPFETFLGFEGEKIPDIDLNFSSDNQSKIHNEVKKIFGEDYVFRAGTISTVAEKTAFGYVKTWIENEDKKFSDLFIDFLAKGVTGTKRTTGQHPGGIIIIPKEFKVEDFTPINFPANNTTSTWKTTHFDFHSIHDNVLKLDLLGHDDPTAIRKLEELTGVNAKKDISFSDPRVISLFSSLKELKINSDDINGEKTGAMGIPEFGTKFVRGMLEKVNVQSFGDLISLSGLSHGTDVWTGNAEKMIKSKKITLDDLISCRDDIMTDLINKGIKSSVAFKIMESVRRGKGITFGEEAKLKEKHVEDWYIDALKKIKYMFPKAHATAYVMMAWRIAWFKLYHPLAYYSTYFTTRPDVFDLITILKGKNEIKEKLNEFKKRKYSNSKEKKLTTKEILLVPIFEICLELLARGIKISNVQIDKSKATDWFFEKETNTLIPPFTSIDGLGAAVAKKIVIARNDAPFISVDDLKLRGSINTTLIEFFKQIEITKDLPETNQISFFKDFNI